MPYTEESVEVVTAHEQWLRKYRFTPDAQVNAFIRKKVVELLDEFGGVVSPSHFERIYLQLTAAGVIERFRESGASVVAAQVAAASVPADVVAWIENPNLSAYTLQKRYTSDKAFAKLYDLYERQKLEARAAEEEAGVNLTAAQYNAMSSSEAVRRYRSDKSFKKGVDRLIKNGEI